MGQNKSKVNKGRGSVGKSDQNKSDNKSEDMIAKYSLNMQSDNNNPIDSEFIPSWLTEQLFADFLKDHVESFENISRFLLHDGSCAGDSSSALLLRVMIDVELKDKTNKNLSFVLKVPHDNEKPPSIADSIDSENQVYSTVISEIEQMYNAVGVNFTFAPKSYKFTKDVPQNYVLLEDLRKLGFQNADTTECLDMGHAKCVLQKLAQYHAATATRVATKGSYEDALMNGLSNHKSMIASCKTAFLNSLKDYKDGEKYEPHLRKILEALALDDHDSMKACDETQFSALNHGDLWSNNILFKYNDAGDIVDTQFVGYGMPNYGSPAQDLYYFLISSLQMDFKFKNFDHLMRVYYDNLIENLRTLKYPRKLPPLREIYIQLFKEGNWGLVAALITLPKVLMKARGTAPGGSEDDMDLKTMMYSNERFKEQINEILPWLYNRGLLQDDSSLKISEPSKTSLPLSPTALKVQIPEWVNQGLFTRILKENFTDYKSLKSFNAKPGTIGGDNYASLLLEVNIEMELENHSKTRNVSFIMKVQLENAAASAIFSHMNMFQKEILLYEELIPNFEGIFRKAGIDIRFGPKFYSLSEKTESVTVILENLRPLGYKNCNRLDGLDEDHTKAVLCKLAQFHAASAVYALDREFPDILHKGMYTEEGRGILEQMALSMLPLFYEQLKTFKGYEEYYDKLVVDGKAIFDGMFTAYNRKDNCLNVLNHGDTWTNNILFKYDENGKIESTYLIDYQMVQYGSPAIDLYYFLISSPTFDIKLAKFDDFVQYYYDHLVEYLKLLNYPKHIPTFEEFEQEMKDNGVLGYCATMSILTPALLDPTDLAKIENVMSEEAVGLELKKQMYSNPRYRKHAEAIFLWLNARGFLDAK